MGGGDRFIDVFLLDPACMTVDECKGYTVPDMIVTINVKDSLIRTFGKWWLVFAYVNGLPPTNDAEGEGLMCPLENYDNGSCTPKLSTRRSKSSNDHDKSLQEIIQCRRLDWIVRIKSSTTHHDGPAYFI